MSSDVVQDDLKLLILLTPSLSDGITGACHHFWFVHFQGLNPGILWVLGNVIPTELHPQPSITIFIINNIYKIPLSSSFLGVMSIGIEDLCADV